MTDIHYFGSDGWPLYARIVGACSGVGAGPAVVLMHGGGPDHNSLVPLAASLSDRYPVVLPDVRGYGRSVCRDPSKHTWTRYAQDVADLLDHLNLGSAVLGGTGLGATIALRAAVERPARVRALIAISLEDIEDDEAKQAEIVFMKEFADRVRECGIEAAWEPILPNLAPVIATLVRDAIPRCDPASIAAAAAIGNDRSFRSTAEMAGIEVPTLLIPGMDERHPRELAEELANLLPAGEIATGAMSAAIQTSSDLAAHLGPGIKSFLDRLPQ